MRVKAKQTGYFGVIRETGDIFEVPDDTPECPWFDVVDEDGDPAPKKKGKGKQGEEPLA